METQHQMVRLVSLGPGILLLGRQHFHRRPAGLFRFTTGNPHFPNPLTASLRIRQVRNQSTDAALG